MFLKQECGTNVKIILGMLSSRIGVSGLQLGLCSWFRLLTTRHGSGEMKARVVESLSPLREAQREFMATFSFLWPLGHGWADGRLCLPFSNEFWNINMVWLFYARGLEMQCSGIVTWGCFKLAICFLRLDSDFNDAIRFSQFPLIRDESRSTVCFS